MRFGMGNHAVLLLPALSRLVMEEWWVGKLTITNKLKINDLISLLSSKDEPLLTYMHVFRIMQNVEEQFVSGMLRVLIYF